MRLATRVLFTALVMLVLCAAVSAQTLRPESDPRNQAPTVGTGGPPGGPTGLFTVYDGDTIRRGEYTFSFAYSNYDRDPGDVDIVETPLSFNIGLNDYIELFFNTNGYRGVKVNNPRHLSSFYLPNSQFLPNLCVGPAIILAPDRVSGATGITGMVFRPAGPPCNVGGQRFVQFPFVGGVGPNFGLTGNPIAPPFVSRLGTPTAGGGNFGDASMFPGVGSVVGSILPGIVLTTRNVPPNLTFNGLNVPDLFTVAPTYIADAPFINRLYGESMFGSFTIGAKIRFTGPNNPLGVGIVPFYRFYPDKADDFSGFNQLQRGASPGGDIGDFGLVGFAGGRLAPWAHLSANVGLIINSNPQSEGFGGEKVTLLNRPDELVAGLGFDFPVNKHFQIITEVKSIHYIRSKTTNAFPNNPIDLLAGVRVFPRRWLGLSGAYRLHVNQQGDRLFHSQTYPAGFRESTDPNGFIAQFWIGHRNARSVPPPLNVEPTVSVSSSAASITLPCPEGTASTTCVPSASREVTLTADARDQDNDTLLHTWSVTGGRITGEGRTVSWDLSGVNPGTYTVSVEVNDGNQHKAFASATVAVANCADCKPPCPTVSVSCPADVDEGASLTISASVSDGSSMSLTYNWSVSAGTISGGQGTSTITVDTAGLGGQTVTATVELGGVDPACSRTASCSTSIRTTIVPPRKFDEYGNIRFNDEKARLDNYAIQLQNEPGSQGYIIAYGGRRGAAGEAQARADRAKNYLVNTRGIDAGRLVTLDGGYKEDLTVELWIVPTGANPPTASPTVDASEVQIIKPRGRRRRGDE